MLSPDAVQMAIDAYHAAPRKGKTEAITRCAALLGVHPATLRRALRSAGVVLGSSRKRHGNERYREWTRVIVGIACKTPAGAPPVPMWMALKQAVASGLVPAEAADVPLGTYYRISKELGYAELRRTTRIGSDHPNQAWQIDASTSEHFVVLKELDDGDYLVRLSHKPYSEYKNKPLAAHRLRLCVYSVTDMRTGCSVSRYVAAKGENAVDAMDFLLWVMGRGHDLDVMWGVPDDLWADQGPVVKHASTRNLLERLGVNIVLGTPGNKERMGQVERSHRTRWGFERSFYMFVQEKGALELKLSEMNAYLLQFIKEMNLRPARFDLGMSKSAAWIRGMAGRGGVKPLPEGAMQSLCFDFRRFVGRDGIFRLNNELYEVKESRLLSRHVYVHRGLDGLVTVEDIQTGEIYPATPYEPKRYGEITGVRKTAGERLKQEAQSVSAGLADHIFAPRPAESSKIRAFQPKTLEPDELDNPLDASCYRTMEAAMRDFMELSGVYAMAFAQRAQIEGIIRASGMSREKVQELAGRIRRAVNM